jgi:hypothetical protein
MRYRKKPCEFKTNATPELTPPQVRLGFWLIAQTRPSLRRLTRPAGCSSTTARHGRVLGHRPLSQGKATPSLPLTTVSFLSLSLVGAQGRQDDPRATPVLVLRRAVAAVRRAGLRGGAGTKLGWEPGLLGSFLWCRPEAPPVPAKTGSTLLQPWWEQSTRVRNGYGQRTACTCTRFSGEKVANRNVRDFGWEMAHGAVTRRPPISLYTKVP